MSLGLKPRNSQTRLLCANFDFHCRVPRAIAVRTSRRPTYSGPYERVMTIELSIVICTRKRASRFSGMLNSLESLRSKRPWEVLLVDNGSTDDTPRILRLACEGNSRIRTLRITRVGLGAARDAGWRGSKGGIVAFTDDDCYLDRYFVDCLLEVFDERTEIGCVGGGAGYVVRQG